MFQWRHPLYSLAVVQSITPRCITRTFSSHMLRDAGIGWWRSWMTMTHMSLVYIECFRNLRKWQKVNVVGTLFMYIWLCHSSFCRHLLGAWFFLPPVTRIFPNGFSIPLHCYSHANNTGRNMFFFYDYYIDVIPVCSSFAPIPYEMFRPQWYIIN